jgi:phage shock protein A
MNWLDRFTFIVRSSVTTIREKVEDPPRMIHQLLVDMEEEHERIRRSVAESIADEIQLRRRVDQAREESGRWQDRARQALSRGEEHVAKSALEQKMLAEQRADGLAKEYDAQKSQVEKLQRSVQDLEDKIRQARQKKTLLVARMARAESERKIRGALNRADQASAFASFRRLEERVERAEALAEAEDRLDGKDPDAEALDRDFEAKEFQDRLGRELEDLKRAMVGDTSET